MRFLQGAKPPLLVLGASEDQLPVYRDARRRGIPSVAVDARSDRPALGLATSFLHVSTRDCDAIAAALGPVELAGVVTVASDVCLLGVHALSRRYGTAELVPGSALLPSMDKTAFHEVAARSGVPRYRWVACRDVAELTVASRKLSYPLVAKPTDSSGSRGVVLVAAPGDLPAAFAAAQAESFSGEVLLEEFVAGRAVTVELFLAAGRARLAAASEKRHVPGSPFVTERHTCPARIDDAARRRLVDAAVRVALAMGMADGAVDLDFVLTPDGTPYVLEAGARLGGNGLAYVLHAAYGVDIVSAIVSQACGRRAELVCTRSRHAILHVLGSPLGVDGTLVEIEGVKDVRAIPGVERLELYANRGDTIHPFVHSGNKFGYLCVSGGTPADAEAALAQALSTLRTVIEPDAAANAGQGLPAAVPIDAREARVPA